MRVIAIAATSLDGFITQGKIPGTAFTSPEDKQWFGEVLKNFPVRIMGRKTFDVSRDHILRAARSQPDELRFVRTQSPRSFCRFEVQGRLIFTDQSPPDILDRVSKAGYEDESVAILGGGPTYSDFLKTGLLDEFWITLEPKLFGNGATLLNDQKNSRVKLLESVALGPSTLLLKYDCRNRGDQI